MCVGDTFGLVNDSESLPDCSNDWCVFCCVSSCKCREIMAHVNEDVDPAAVIAYDADGSFGRFVIIMNLYPFDFYES